ncbi:hypothetical protein N9O53_05425 [Candidatus Pelagibacter ubique]|nr:hypothetical protein [Candidatus Pelagibacter ubique]
MSTPIKHPYKIQKSQIFDATYVFIDGMSRSGKSGIAPIVSSLENVEHFKIRANFDRFLMVYASGNLTKDGFKYLFETDLILDVWFGMMGRDVNTNLHDISSIVNSPKYKEYLSRMSRKDTLDTFNKVANEIKDRKLIFPFIIDNYMTIGSFIEEINENFKYIIVVRHPIDFVFTWFRSGRGSSLGTNPYYIKPAFQVKNFDNIPYLYLDNPEEYSNANPLEKCFLVIEKQLTAYINSNLLYSKNSCLVPFEHYVNETEGYIKKFENLLGTNRTNFTNAEMVKANVPRNKDMDTFSKKANMIFDNMNKIYVDRLIKLSELYERKISGFYKLNLITKYPEGKFKGLSFDEFSKVSGHSLYHKGKRSTEKK